MSDWKKIIADAEAIRDQLKKRAFLPMPPDQTSASAGPPSGGQQQMPPQGGQPMPPQGGQQMPPQGGGPPQMGPDGQPMQGGQPVTMDPMMRLDQLEQMVGEQGTVLQEMMSALGDEIAPALEQVMEKMTTHDNAILEVSTLASGASNKADSIMQELTTAMGGDGGGQPPQQQPAQ